MRRGALMLLVMLTCFVPARAAAPDELVAGARAAYPALKTYSDTGVVIDKFGPDPANEYRHTFQTYFRAPRNFYFEFRSDARSGGNRIVIWCDGGDFQSWVSATGQHATYPRGSNTAALPFQQSAFATKGSVTLIPALIFAGSGLVSAFAEFGEPQANGTETIIGTAAQKLTGVARSVYPQTHRETNVRRAIVWIDPETRLLRKMFEDTPVGLPATAVMRITTILEPKANPPLDDAVFRFTPPR